MSVSSNTSALVDHWLTPLDHLAVPPGIGWATTIKPGHIVSNEPGFYLEGEWGIRIESVVVCKEIEVSWQRSSLSQFASLIL
jgi:Xaa-Pro aminopeptidase